MISAIQQAKRDLFIDTAEGTALSVIGQNYGVARPQIAASDDLYRRLVQVLAWMPKQVNFAVYSLLEAVFGSQADLVAASTRPWRVYEVNANEIIIELPASLIGTSNENASYLHGWSGYAFVPSGPSNTFTTPGDVSESSATTLVGKAIHVLTAPGTWTSYTISTFSYSLGVSTITVSAATLPTGGGYFYVEVPGDDIDSYRGDYIASSGFVSTYSTLAGPLTDTLSVLGDTTSSLVPGHTVTLHYGNAPHTHTIVSGVYDPATNRTALVVALVTVPGGLVAQTIVRNLEVSDTSSTPAHADRVYLTGLGAFEIVQYYMDLLVRAAGIVVRIEQI